jgi:membrane protein DedA with SNARE-associated domain
MTAGCILGYLLGSRATGAARRFVGAESLARAEGVAADYGNWAIVVCRPVPVLAEASVILAGLVRTPWRRFLLLTSASNLGIAAAYAAVGTFSMSAGSFLLTFAGALALPGLAMVAARLWLRR